MAQKLYIICAFVALSIPMLANALPPPSPAGGNYLILDGKDDYAELNFNSFGILLPKGTDEFTVELWVYPTIPPDFNITASILNQQVMIDVVSNDHPGYQFVKKSIIWNKRDLLLIARAHVAGWGGNARAPFLPITLKPNQWNHIAYQAKWRQTAVIVNDVVKTFGQGVTIGTDLSKFWRPKDFTIGGFGKKIAPPNVGGFFSDSFAGYIDEVHISSVARYDTKKVSIPDRKFKKDRETIALWHFDGQHKTEIFSDSSGNSYHLTGKNGARITNPLAIQVQGKLTSIWGQLKR